MRNQQKSMKWRAVPILTPIYNLLYLLPATIHPMVVHFTIAILYLAVLTEVIAYFKKDNFYERAGFLLLGLGVLSTIAAGVAGVVSEHYDIITPPVAALLATHRFFGETTGVIFLIAFAIRFVTRRRKPSRVVLGALLISVVGLVFVTYTGHLGGDLVYNNGLGVKVAGLGRRHF